MIKLKKVPSKADHSKIRRGVSPQGDFLVCVDDLGRAYDLGRTTIERLKTCPNIERVSAALHPNGTPRISRLPCFTPIGVVSLFERGVEILEALKATPGLPLFQSEIQTTTAIELVRPNKPKVSDHVNIIASTRIDEEKLALNDALIAVAEAELVAQQAAVIAAQAKISVLRAEREAIQIRNQSRSTWVGSLGPQNKEAVAAECLLKLDFSQPRDAKYLQDALIRAGHGSLKNISSVWNGLVREGRLLRLDNGLYTLA